MFSHSRFSSLRIGLIESPSAVMTASTSLPAAASASISREPGVEKGDSFRAPCLEAIGDSEPQFVVPLPRGEGVWRQKKIVERPKRAAAFDPDIAGAQAVAQCHDDGDLISPAVGGSAGTDELAPRGPQKCRRRARRQFPLIRRVEFAQHVERGKQRIVGFP